jgi:membrane protease YdiL (CAAX protease family)
MTVPLLVSTESAAAESATQPKLPAEEKRQRWLEVLLVLVISLGGSFASSVYMLVNPPRTALEMTTLRSFYGMFHESVSLLLLWYVLSRRRLGFRDLGLRWSLRGFGIGVVVTVLAVLSYVIGALLLQGIHYGLYGRLATMPHARQFFANPSLVMVPFILLNAFFEELIVRAYLMMEIKELTGSTVLAVISSVVVQASYHLYYGWMGALCVAFMFLTFAIYFARSRQALPIIIAHEIFDLYALIRLW